MAIFSIIFSLGLFFYLFGLDELFFIEISVGIILSIILLVRKLIKKRRN